MTTSTPEAGSTQGSANTVLDAIMTRASASKLVAPGPNATDLERIMTAGARAPDHGKLRPWRFVVLQDQERSRLGDLMADSLKARDPSATEPLLANERQKAMRAPTIIVVAAAVQPEHPKIPAIEQMLAVGAGVQNMILAAEALGYGTMWKTGDAAYDSSVKVGLNLAATDQIVAFFYVGTPASRGTPRKATLEGLLTPMKG
jgi:nitroreductase